VHRVLHTFRRATDGLRRAPFVTAVAVGTIFVAVLLTGAFAAALGAGQRLLGAWAGEVPVSVYLAPGTDLEQARRAAAAIAPGAEVEGVTPTEAMQRLRASLGEQGRVLDGLGDDVLPASVEVRTRGATLARVRALAVRLREVPGATEVDDGAGWLSRLEQAVEQGRMVGLGLLLLLATATAILVANTLRLAVYARREEISIQKLVGATDAYVGVPILLEGILQGLLGSALAAAALAGAAWGIVPRLRAALPIAARLTPADLLPVSLLVALVVGGALLGALASGLALGRFLRRPDAL
jgi:cell division transport system permease protein